MNYCDADVPFTRIVEPKFFTPWEKNDKTVYIKEYSKETTERDIPYYPKRLANDKKILQQYRTKAGTLKGVSFLGRLATYRYMDMHHVISEAYDFSELFLKNYQNGVTLPVFPNTESL